MPHKTFKKKRRGDSKPTESQIPEPWRRFAERLAPLIAQELYRRLPQEKQSKSK